MLEPEDCVLPPADPDPLSDVLRSLRMDGTFYCRTELSAPWGLTMPAMPNSLWFHSLLSGRCTVRPGGDEEPFDLAPGGFVLIPHGDGHEIYSEEGVPLPVVTDVEHERADERYGSIRYGGGGERTLLVCGVVCFDDPAVRDLVAVLPRLLHLDPLGSPQSEWMQSTLRLMAAEAHDQAPGSETIVSRLADILVVQAMRTWLERDPEARAGWVGALRDEKVGRAMALVHRNPGADWTVASLARQAGMSRSVFAAKFHELVGEAPMAWVTGVRLRVARTRLEQTNRSVGEIASELGYGSEAAFSRAYKRSFGLAPGASRRELRRESALAKAL